MIRRRTLLSGMLPTVSVSVAAQGAPSAALRSALEQRLQAQGVGFVVFQLDGEEVRFAVAGRSRRDGPAVGPDTLFEIGSITKTFTALLLADAVVRRELTLDTPAESLLPGRRRLRDSTGEPIRLIDLATHRSGLPRLPPNLAPADPSDPYADYTVDQLLAFIERWQAQAPRDTRYEYSNLGMGLLGHLLGRQHGSDYPTRLAERVLAPLQIDAIVLPRPGATPANAAQGHDLQGHVVPPWRFDALSGAGALLGSARSLARYAQALVGRREHPLREAVALCLRRHGDTDQPTTGTGLAWLLARVFDQRCANHDGSTGGFASSFWLDLDGRRGAGVLANALVGVQDLALHALDARWPVTDLRALTQIAAVEVAPALLDVLTGVYAATPAFKVAVRQRDGRLFAQATAQGEFELFARSPRSYFARVTPLTIDFEGEAGPPQAFVLEQGGRRTRFVREP